MEKLMTIEILGDGCSKCKVMKKNVQQAIDDLGLHTEVSSVMDPERIAKLEVLSLPQLVIDGQIAPSSISSSVESIKDLLRNVNMPD
jgi:small redox-active disulfide protein 2